ncbi:MAG: 16S rRNA (uracil(1498)-N(3))-methyltransferase [Candidatus Abyssobacteria bacterium SURF_17]|uniref:Ribosomal RNA small subunit methyltransferase E n=1 Tax=Candidatus Abyssobacteria bacterium SURF_17 TaxID=2093361 RepID=A0A419EXY6_9BACT|nr:MAG: 16S rRNA (uracil(1498)-N(3))-methyltransferase [Candidatus Abyssubacteria bacterium SURF_17]
MTTHQFFIKQSQIDADQRVTIEGADARHMRLVLRLKKGNKVRLIDENRNQHVAVVEKVMLQAVHAHIVESCRSDSVPLRVSVVQGIPRMPKADVIAQKLTEIGVQSLVFVPTEHACYTDALERVARRLPRLRKIAEAAAKQCIRCEIPDILISPNLREAVETLNPDGLLLVADEKASGKRLCTVLDCIKRDRPITVFVGPEGGFSPYETRLLKGAGAVSFSLGRNILRTETAALVAAAIVLYELGEI